MILLKFFPDKKILEGFQLEPVKIRRNFFIQISQLDLNIRYWDTEIDSKSLGTRTQDFSDILLTIIFNQKYMEIRNQIHPISMNEPAFSGKFCEILKNQPQEVAAIILLMAHLRLTLVIIYLVLQSPP